MTELVQNRFCEDYKGDPGNESCRCGEIGVIACEPWGKGRAGRVGSEVERSRESGCGESG
jgi:hypothetical protein